MKKRFLFLAVLLMSVSMVNPCFSQVNKSEKKTPAPLTTKAIPEDLQQIFKKSCMDCHATGGKRIAMMKVNFSSWDTYTSEKQPGKAAAICKVVTKGSMPTKAYVKSHPDAALTQAQKDQICKWSATIKK